MFGILIGTDLESEWLLKWWWNQYKQFNSYPIAIADFGMSKGALQWCKEIGTVFKPACVKSAEPEEKKKWEDIYGSLIWKSRNAWLKKPFAFLESPFKRTLWIDLDCEILGLVKPLSELSDPICLALEPKRCQQSKFVLYNSGVVVFEKEHPIIQKWAENVIHHGHRFMGDQDVLSWTLEKENYKPKVIDPIYNWRPACGENKDAVIIHHAGQRGKSQLFARKFDPPKA